MPCRGAIALVVVSAMLCIAALGTRTLTSIDLGYHLAYGERALETGHLVDHNPYLYTLPPQELSEDSRPDPGPGSWYDEQGRYHFPNANWLSQISMAAVYRIGGPDGLSLLTLALVLTLGGLQLRLSRRLGLAWPVAAMGLLWFGLVAFSRLNLRPELFGYLALAAEAAILAPLVLDPRRAARLTLPQVVALTALHALFVNFHSYWMLGLLLPGAVLLQCFVPRRSQGAGEEPAWGPARARAGLLLAAMAMVSFANPWTWRLAVLPIETLLYLQEHQIAGVPGAHPWSHILEFRGTLHPSFPARVSDFAIAALLLLGAAGSVAAVFARRWALLTALVTMSAAAISMRRNVAPAALVVIPFGLAALQPALRGLGLRLSPARLRRATTATTWAVVVAAAVFTAAIVTNRFYLAEGHPIRFGTGIGAAHLPVGAARWLDAHLPGARVWCDMASSSTLHFFTEPHREVPILSNTWAYPPSVMTTQQALRSLQQPAERLISEYRAEAVVIDYERSPPLFRALIRHPSWKLVHVEGRNILLARSTGERGAVVRANALDRVDDVPALVKAHVARQRETDPAVLSALLHPGIVYLHAGLGELAAATFGAVARERPDAFQIWNYLGLAHRVRAKASPSKEQTALTEARRAFTRALELEPGNDSARQHLEQLPKIDRRP